MLQKFIYALSAYYTCASDPAPNTEGSQVLECKNGEPCWDFFKAAFETAKKQPRSRNSGSLDPNRLVLSNFRNEFLIPMIKTETDQTENIQSRSTTRVNDLYPVTYTVNYGCWCPTYGDNYELLWPSAAMRLEPVDEYDDNCKTYVMNSRCIAIDAEYENIECDPYSTDYDGTMTYQFDDIGDMLSLTVECTQTVEEDWCKGRVCLNDLAYMAEQWRLIYSSIHKKNDYGHWDTKEYNFFTDSYEITKKGFDTIRA